MRSSTITFTCDLCGTSKSIKDDSLPNKWKRIGDKEICSKCVECFVRSITLEEAKKMVKNKEPVYDPPHPVECHCQACCCD